MHPRVSLHQVGFMDRSSATFVAECRAMNIPAMTLVTPLLTGPGALQETRAAISGDGPRVTTINHPFASATGLDRDDGTATAGLMQAVDIAADLGASAIYLLSGARGSLDWEAAAESFAALIAPCRQAAAARDVMLLVENANSFNADIHIAHTLADMTRLAETAGIGVCLDLHACWFEGGLEASFRRALPLTGLVQISDYVLGDRSTPCRAVPGDGAMPLERLIGSLLDLGYAGMFDLELAGPRIREEGAAAASERAAEWLSETLVRLGA